MKDIFTKSQSIPVVDVVFMWDCTGSMQPLINSVKQIIKDMIEDLKIKYIDSSLFIGFIGYRDHTDN